MIYIVGSDLESKDGIATSKINQMLESDIDFESVNVFIQTGGSSKWAGDIPSDKNVIYKLSKDGLNVAKEKPSQNMAAPETLAEFLSFCFENTESDAYSLILWDHGGGPIYGYGYDEISDDRMSLQDISVAMQKGPFDSQNKLEWIGLDACFMGSIETAFAFYEYADYLVASQETEPGWGWNYSFLGSITSSTTSEEVAVSIIDYYLEACSSIFDEYPNTQTDVTLSCLNLKYIPDVAKELDTLYNKACVSLDSSSFPSAARARSKAKEFGRMNTSGFSYDLVDLMHLSSQMSDNYSEESSRLNDAIDLLVMYNQTNAANANGVSIYFPYHCKANMDNLNLLYKSIDFSNGFANYIQKFVELQNGEQLEDWDLSNSAAGQEPFPDSPRPITPEQARDYMQESGLDFSVQLTPEQVRTFGTAYYLVLQQTNDAYFELYSSSDVVLNSDGKLTANYNGKTQKIKDVETGESGFCRVHERERTDVYIRYHIYALLTSFGMTEEYETYYESQLCALQMETDANGNNPKFLSAVPINEDGYLAPKQLIDIYDYEYEYACFLRSGKVPTYDRKGNLNPYDEWEKYDGVAYSDIKLNQDTRDSFEFVNEELDLNEKYFVIFNIFDVQGNRTTSNLIPINFYD